MAEATPKPITSDPDEQELLASMNIPLTDPNAKRDVDETHTPPAEAPADETKEETPADTVKADAGADAAGDAVGDGGADGAEPLPAAADAADPAPKPGADDGGGDGTAPASATTPAKPAVAAAEPVLSEAAKRMAEVEELILAESFDPFSVEGRKLQLEHNKLAAKVEAEPLVAEKRWNDAFAPYAQQFPEIEQSKMEEAWKTQRATYAKRGFTGDALTAAATVAFEMELQQIANGKKGAAAAQVAADKGKPGGKGAVVAPPVAKTPITPKGAIVAPPAATPVSTPRVAMTDEEELVATQRRLNPQGMRQALRG